MTNDVFSQGDMAENRESRDQRQADFNKYDQPARVATFKLLEKSLAERGLMMVDFRSTKMRERTPDLAVVGIEAFNAKMEQIRNTLGNPNILPTTPFIQSWLRDKSNIHSVLELSIKTRWEPNKPFPYENTHLPPRKRHYFDYVDDPSKLLFIEYNSDLSQFCVLSGKDVWAVIEEATTNGTGFEETTVESGNQEKFLNIPHTNAVFGVMIYDEEDNEPCN